MDTDARIPSRLTCGRSSTLDAKSDAQREQVLDVSAGAGRTMSALLPGSTDQTEGGEVLGALARTKARPGRGAGSTAGRTATGGATSRTAALTT